MAPEMRAREGLFLAFQYPVEIPGVSNVYFLKNALNAIRKHRGEPEVDAMDFLKLTKEKAKLVQIDEDLVKRPVNEGCSGGEKRTRSSDGGLNPPRGLRQTARVDLDALGSSPPVERCGA